MNTSIWLSPPVLRVALVGGLFVGLVAQACGSSGSGGSENGGSGGMIGAGGTTGSGGTSGGTSTGGAGTGRSASGGAGNGGVGSGGGGTGGNGNGGSGAGGTGTGGRTGSGGADGGSTGGVTADAGGSTGGVGAADGGRDGATDGGRGGATDAAAFNPCTGAACIVMPLGDSITDGVGSAAPGGGYRVELFHDAVQAHKALTFVGSATDPNGPTMLDGKTFPRNHEGHPGFTIDDSATTSGISPLVDQSIATNHPQIILLMIGTNDVNRNIDVANAPTRLGALLDRMINDAPNALVVVAKITPTPDDGANAVVQTYNNAIPGLVQSRAANGKHITMVDMYGAFTARADYKTALMNDFLHPNDAGYVVMGDVWYAAIQSYLPTAP
jgi:lysophospholipase L1-like esterase